MPQVVVTQGNAAQERLPSPRINELDNEAELKALRTSVDRGRPYGDPDWQRETARRLGLQSTLRPPGRPRKESPE